MRCAVFCLAGLGLAVLASPAQGAHTPASWIDPDCAGGATTGCWVEIPSLGTAIGDPVAGSDGSKNSQPNPSSADISTGSTASRPSIYYGFDEASETVFFRMRLLDTPAESKGGRPPGDGLTGPFSSNTAWNFIMDLDGDGWGDLLASTDGNTGKNGDPYDTIRLAYNPSTTTQEITDDGSCSAGGQVVWIHKAIEQVGGVAVPGCVDNGAAYCEFGFTRVINFETGASCTRDGSGPGDGFSCTGAPGETPITGEGFVLDMQFPLEVFDGCTGADLDGDGIPGDQLLTTDTTFNLCPTTSTQPNDPTAKDLAASFTYSMKKTKPLPCGDSCTLTGGCQAEPTVVEMNTTGCNPLQITAQVQDTLVSLDGNTLSSTVSQVAFSARQVGTVGFTTIGTDTAPGPLLNEWSASWDTTGLSGPYWIKVEVLDQQGNVVSTNNADQLFGVDLDNNCEVFSTPVTLSAFEAVAAGPGGGALVTWATATEAGTLGFRLHRETASGLEPVGARGSAELIPARGLDEVEPRSYRVQLDALGAEETLWLEDLDQRGRSRFHGPFRVGGAAGASAGLAPEHRLAEESAAPAIDWATLRAAQEPEARARRRGVAVEARQRAAAAVQATLAPSSASRKGGGDATPGGDGVGSGPLVRFLVTEEGVHRVTWEQLSAAGFDLTGVPAASLALTRGGAPVPLGVFQEPGRGQGQGQGVGVPRAGTFGPGAYLEFWGEALDTLYTGTNVYRLEIDRSLARPMAVDGRPPVGGAPAEVYRAEVRLEEQNLYSFSAPGDDPWYAARLLAYGAPLSRDFPLQVEGLVEGLAAGAGPAELEVELWGQTDWPAAPDHRVRVFLNGAWLGDEVFDGLVARTLTFPLPEGLLREGENRVTVEVPGDLGVPYDLVNLEALTVRYPRRLDARQGRLAFAADGLGGALRVTGISGDGVAYRLDAGTPTRLTHLRNEADGSLLLRGDGGDRYWVAAADLLLTPGIEAARAPGDLLAGLAPDGAELLVIAHGDFLEAVEPLVAARRAQGLSVRVVDVDDVYARHSGGIVDPSALHALVAEGAARTGTRWLLLVGGDTTDARGFAGTGGLSFIPTPYAATSGIVRFAPADALYGDLDGDGVQDLAVGRLPVRTAAETARVVEKILRYDPEAYGRTALLAADARDSAIQYSFAAVSERVARELPADWSLERAYIDSRGLAGARQDLLAGIEAGAALTSFFGHSSPQVWSFRNLFNTRDAAALGNVDRPTVVVQWGCWNTYYVAPRYDTLGHQLMLAGDGGAAAVLGASTLTQGRAEERLALALVPRLAAPGVSLGEAVVAAKQEVATTHPGDLDILLGWNLLGDPTLAVDP